MVVLNCDAKLQRLLQPGTMFSTNGKTDNITRLWGFLVVDGKEFAFGRAGDVEDRGFYENVSCIFRGRFMLILEKVHADFEEVSRRFR